MSDFSIVPTIIASPVYVVKTSFVLDRRSLLLLPKLLSTTLKSSSVKKRDFRRDGNPQGGLDAYLGHGGLG